MQIHPTNLPRKQALPENCSEFEKFCHDSSSNPAKIIAALLFSMLSIVVGALGKITSLSLVTLIISSIYFIFILSCMCILGWSVHNEEQRRRFRIVIVLGSTVSTILALASSSLASGCWEQIYGTWCEDNELSHGFLVLTLLVPTVFSTVFKAADLRLIAVSWVMVNISAIILIAVMGAMRSVLVLALCSPLTVLMILENYNQNHQAFSLIAEYDRMQKENELLAEQAQANELRHMIGNVAHDLKTPLSGFMSGVDAIASIINEDHAAVDLYNKLPFLRAAVSDIYSINNFMLMTINRCIDFTKASRGMTLVPKFETFHLLETLNLPLHVMISMQKRIEIRFECVDDSVQTAFIISDKQWLQENILCLLSNAVKYSHHGPVRVRVHVLPREQLLARNLHGYSAANTAATVHVAEHRDSVRSEDDVVTIASFRESHMNASSSPLSKLFGGGSPSKYRASGDHDGNRPGAGNRRSSIFRGSMSSIATFIRRISTSANATSSSGNQSGKSSLPEPNSNFSSFYSPSRAKSDIASAHIGAAEPELSASQLQTHTVEYDNLKGDDDEEESKNVAVAGKLRIKPGGGLTMSGCGGADAAGGRGSGHDAPQERSMQRVAGEQQLASPSFDLAAAAFNDSNSRRRDTINSHEAMELPFLLVEIEDHGIGIAESEITKLFNPFKQAQRLAGGTGLGLFSFAKRVEALKGLYGIEKRSDGQQGSMFWFAIPYRVDEETAKFSEVKLTHSMRMSFVADHHSIHSLHSGDNNSNSQLLHDSKDVSDHHDHSGGGGASAGGAIRILLVDDSPTIQKMTSMVLRRQGYQVCQVENGVEAVDKVASMPAHYFDVVFMDLQMPIMDGLEATRRIRARERDLLRSGTVQHQFIIGLSANCDSETMEEAFTAGIDDFIGKPFSIASFLSVYSKHIDEDQPSTTAMVAAAAVGDPPHHLSASRDEHQQTTA